MLKEKWDEDQHIYFTIHDRLYDLTGISISENQACTLFKDFPSDMQHLAFEWGGSDTVFREKVSLHLKKHVIYKK